MNAKSKTQMWARRPMRAVLAAGVLAWASPALADEGANTEPAAQAEAGQAQGDEGQDAKQGGDAAEWRESITSAFSVKVPADWIQRPSKLKRAGRGLGRWGYRSPNGGFKFQVNLERDDGKRTFESMAQSMQRRTWQRYDNVRIEDAQTFMANRDTKAGQRKVHTVIFRGDPKGKKGERRLVFELFTRAVGTKRWVTLRIAAADRRVDELTDVAEKVFDSFELHRR